MGEDELEDWYEKEKERLTEEYYKKLGRDKKEEKEDKDKKKKKAKGKKQKSKNDKEMEDEFLLAMKKLRQDYQKRYEKGIKKKEKSEKVSRIKNLVRAPFRFFLMPLISLLKLLSGAFKKHIKLAIHCVKEGIKSCLSRAASGLGSYYTFHLRSSMLPFFHFFRGIFNFFFRPIKRACAYIFERIKMALDVLIDYFKKIFGFAMGHFKRLMDIFKNYLKKLLGILMKVLKKLSELFAKYIKPHIPSRKKKDEEEY